MMTLKRSWRATLGAFIACLTTGGSAVAASSARAPNIVYILADDLAYGDLGSYGQKLIRTPRLDAMAREGMRFTDYYSGAPSCAPARCVLITGKHTGHARIRANSDRPILPEDATEHPDTVARLAAKIAGWWPTERKVLTQWTQ